MKQCQVNSEMESLSQYTSVKVTGKCVATTVALVFCQLLGSSIDAEILVMRLQILSEELLPE